jgi:hypothetical protein
MDASCSALEMRLSTYHIIPENSPVLHAIQDLDVDEVRRLFTTGLASPYDHIYGLCSHDSLLHHALLQLDKTGSKPKDGNEAEDISVVTKGQRARELIEYLVSCTPGKLRITPWACYTPGSFHAAHYPVVDFERARVLRLILQNCCEDPFAGSDVDFLQFRMSAYDAENPVSQALMTQDDWPLEWNSHFLEDFPMTYIENDRQMLKDPHGLGITHALRQGSHLPAQHISISGVLRTSRGRICDHDPSCIIQNPW